MNEGAGTALPFVTLEITNRQIYDKLEELTRAVNPLPSMVQDHEKRISTIERRNLRWAGAIALIAPCIAGAAGIVGMYAATK